MKIFSKLVLVSLAPAGAAFMTQAPKAFAAKSQTDSASVSFSGLGSALASTPSPQSTADEEGILYKQRKLSTPVGSYQPQASMGAGERAGPAELVASRANKVKVQGGSLKTWSFASPQIQRIHVVLKTEGRPLDADVSLWQGPDNTPHKMRIYVEDGAQRPFSAVIETPRGPNTVQIRNTGQLEFPLDAHVMAEDGKAPSPLPASKSNDLKGPPLTIQGGALRTYPFDQSVESVQILLKTDGRPLRSRIELLQGPNNNKQVVEIYTEDGLDRPFFMVIETPGSGTFF